MDPKLRASLSKIALQIDKLQLVEEIYLNLDDSKKHLHAQLLLEKTAKTVDERKAMVENSPEWKNFCKVLNAKTSEFNREKRWLQLLFAAHDAEYGTWIREQAAIKRGVE